MVRKISKSEVDRARSKAVGGKKPRCRKGKACSASCINSIKICLINAVASVSEGLRTLRGRIESREKSFLDRLKSKDELKGVKIKRKGEDITLTKKVGKRFIDLIVQDRGTSISFLIDGSFDRPKNLSREEGIALIMEVGRMSKAVISTMKPGSVISVSAWDEDDRGLKLSKVYERAGFAPIRKGSTILYGKVGKDGKLEKATLKEYVAFEAAKDFNFSSSVKCDNL